MMVAVRTRPEIVSCGYFAVSWYVFFFFFVLFLIFFLSPQRCLSSQPFSPHSTKGTVWQRSWAQGPDYTLRLVAPTEPARACDRSGEPAGGDDDLDYGVVMCVRSVSMVDPCESLQLFLFHRMKQSFPPSGTQRPGTARPVPGTRCF